MSFAYASLVTSIYETPYCGVFDYTLVNLYVIPYVVSVDQTPDIFKENIVDELFDCFPDGFT